MQLVSVSDKRKGLLMKIMVSACLLGENVKYSGGNNYNEKLNAFLQGHEVISVCPEVLGGLPTPRIPSEIVQGVVTNKEGRSVDEEFRRGAAIVLQRARMEQVELVILQSRSPSCGVKQVYDGTFSGTKIPGQGICAGLLAENGFQLLDVEDLDAYILQEKRRKYSSEEEIPDCGCIYG